MVQTLDKLGHSPLNQNWLDLMVEHSEGFAQHVSAYLIAADVVLKDQAAGSCALRKIFEIGDGLREQYYVGRIESMG